MVRSADKIRCIVSCPGYCGQMLCSDCCLECSHHRPRFCGMSDSDYDLFKLGVTRDLFSPACYPAFQGY